MGCSLKSTAFLALALLVAGCATGPALVQGGQMRVLDITELPAPTHSGYTVGPLDRLKVNVFGVEELNMETIQVDANGNFVLPFAGQIVATGKTPDQLSQEIATALGRAGVRNPQVSVNLQDILSRTVTVDGSVTKPGSYPIGSRTSLMRAIAAAGGLSEFGNARHVVVYRTVGDDQMAALYDLRAIRQGRYVDPQVYSDDVIVVGESAARRAFGYLVASANLLVAPLITLLQR